MSARVQAILDLEARVRDATAELTAEERSELLRRKRAQADLDASRAEAERDELRRSFFSSLHDQKAQDWDSLRRAVAALETEFVLVTCDFSGVYLCPAHLVPSRFFVYMHDVRKNRSVTIPRVCADQLADAFHSFMCNDPNGHGGPRIPSFSIDDLRTHPEWRIIGYIYFTYNIYW